MFVLGCVTVCICVLLFFFFKQKTAYEMRISDWSSDVCSSDLMSFVGDQFTRDNKHLAKVVFDAFYWTINFGSFFASLRMPLFLRNYGPAVAFGIPGILIDRKSVVSGKSVSVRVDLGGRRIINKKQSTQRLSYHKKKKLK